MRRLLSSLVVAVATLVVAAVASAQPHPITVLAWTDHSSYNEPYVTFEVESLTDSILVECNNLRVVGPDRYCDARFSRATVQSIHLRARNSWCNHDDNAETPPTECITVWSNTLVTPIVPAGQSPGVLTILGVRELPFTQVPMATTWQATTPNGMAGTLTETVTAPTVLAGDILCVLIQRASESVTMTALSDSVNGTWTNGVNAEIAGPFDDAGGTARIYVAFLRNTGAGTPVITSTWSGAGAGGFMHAFTGRAGAGEFGTFEGWTTPTINGSAVTAHVGAAGTSTGANGTVVDFFWCNSNRTRTASAGTLINNINTTQHSSFTDFSSAGAHAQTITSNTAVRSIFVRAVFSVTSGGGAFDIQADPGALAISGTAAGLRAQRRIAAEAASYSIGGTPATLTTTRRMVASAASYAIAGTAASLERGKRLVADAAAYLLTGQAASLERGTRVAADAGSVAISGTAATMRATRRVTAAPGAIAVAGTAASLERGRFVVAAPGSVAIAGSNAGLLTTRRVVAAPGAVAIAGQDATLSRTREIVAQAGAFTISGTPASLERGRFVVVEPGVFSIAGQPTTLQVARRIAAQSASLTINGTDAGLLYESEDARLTADMGLITITGTEAQLRTTRRILAQAGAFTIAGTDATLSADPVLLAQPASINISGTDAALRATRHMTAGLGTFVITGQDASALVGRRVAADAAHFSIVGSPSTLRVTRRLFAEGASFLVFGTDARLDWSGLVLLPADVTRTVHARAQSRIVLAPAINRIVFAKVNEE